jgi:hypothetical protein
VNEKEAGAKRGILVVEEGGEVKERGGGLTGNKA